jgi:hypothetical protein
MAQLGLTVSGGQVSRTSGAPDLASQPPRMHLPVPVHAASGSGVRTTVLAEHLLHLCTAAGTGETTVRVNTSSNVLGITRGRLSGAVVHLQRQCASSTSDGAAVHSAGRCDVASRRSVRTRTEVPGR